MASRSDSSEASHDFLPALRRGLPGFDQIILKLPVLGLGSLKLRREIPNLPAQVAHVLIGDLRKILTCV